MLLIPRLKYYYKMYKIGDFSQMAQVSVRMLRHYDKLGLLKPEHVDDWTGYRYYTLEQLTRLHRILAFKDLGLSLQQISDVIDDPGADEHLHNILIDKQRSIEKQMEDDRARLERVMARINQINKVHEPIHYDIALKELPAQQVAALREVVPHVSKMDIYRDRMLRTLYTQLSDAGISPGLEMAIYHHQAYTDENISMSLAVEVKEDLPAFKPDWDLSIYQLPSAPLAASIIHDGSLWKIPELVINLFRWLGMNGYGSAGAYRELHHFGRELDLFADDPDGNGLIEILVPAVRL
jgi:DNA-binding transcriptional MerR regulator